MKLKYFSHSSFQITTDSGIDILIDPFFAGNPTSQQEEEPGKRSIAMAYGGELDL